MNKTAVLTVAMLGFSGPAFAAGVDEVATTDLASAAHAPGAEPAAKSRHGQKGKATQRATARPAGGPAHAAPARPAPARPSAPNAGASQRTIVHPTPGRPGNTVVHTTPHHPGQVVVHHGPRGTSVAHTAPVRGPVRPVGPVVHGTAVRPGSPVRPGYPVRPVHPVYPVHHAVVGRTVTYGHVYPYHGVFVYGPRPVTHVTYVRTAGPVQVHRQDLPERKVDRDGSFALGLKGGTLISGTPSGHVYGDPGLGLVAQYRPAESMGLELALSHHGMALDELNTRSQTQVAGSVDLFAFPWSRVSPYALAGVTWNGGSVQDATWTGDSYTTVSDASSQLGLHAGLGLELALGKSASIDLEGRYIGWVSDSTPETRAAPGALQATAGLMVHFK